MFEQKHNTNGYTYRQFYREPSGDYLMVFNADGFEARAAAFDGHPSSVCTTVLGLGYLETCERVKWHQVPRRWRRAIVGPYTTAAHYRLMKQRRTA